MKISRRSSVILSFVFLFILLTGIIIGIFMVPHMMDYAEENFHVKCNLKIPAAVLIYATAAVGLCAVFLMFGLLMNIIRDFVFVDKNVFYLRMVSWCCIIAGLDFIVLSFYWIPLSLGAVGALFMGAVIRVVKNVIEDAVAIKNENDFTI